MTKNLSGAARCTIDACRTLFVWAFSLAAGWERFHGLEARLPFFLPSLVFFPFSQQQSILCGPSRCAASVLLRCVFNMIAFECKAAGST